jgi:hypothetical protein
MNREKKDESVHAHASKGLERWFDVANGALSYRGLASPSHPLVLTEGASLWEMKRNNLPACHIHGVERVGGVPGKI